MSSEGSEDSSSGFSSSSLLSTSSPPRPSHPSARAWLRSRWLAPIDARFKRRGLSSLSRLRNVLILLFHLLLLPASLTWSIGLFFAGAPLSSIAPAVYFIVDVLSLSHLWCTAASHAKLQALAMLALLMALPVWVHCIGGGFTATSHVLAWSFIPIPLAGVLFRSRRVHGYYLLGATLSLTFATLVTESSLFTAALSPIWREEALSSSIRLAFSILNVYIPPLIFFAVMLYYVYMAERSNLTTFHARKDAHQAVQIARRERSANEAKSRFLSVMSHEIRNPLSLVVLNAELLQGTPLSDSQAEMLDGIAKASDMLLSLVSNVLDLNKIELGKVDLEVVPFDLRESFEFVLQTLSPKARTKGVEVGLVAPPGLPVQVRGDPTRLRQILTNFVSNAIKFTEAGHVVVRVSIVDENFRPGLDRDPDRAAQVLAGTHLIKWMAEVQDTGIGMSPEGQSRLFQEFEQADNTVTRKYGGSGLGLVIAKELCELMGGVIIVSSEEGVGTTMSFSFVTEVDSDPGVSKAAEVVHVDALAEKWSVLVCAKDPAVREPIESYVRYFFGSASGVNICTGTSGNDVLKFIAKANVDVAKLAIIVDSSLVNPAVRDMAASASRDDVKMVLIHDYPDRNTRLRLREEGWCGLIYKPITFMQACSVLDSAISDAPHGTAASSVNFISNPTSRHGSRATSGRRSNGASSPRGSGVRQHSPSQHGSSVGFAVSRGARKRGMSTSGTLTRGFRIPNVEPEHALAEGARPAGPRILVVDDFDLIKDLLARVVMSLGYTVDTAADGVELVAKVKEARAAPYFAVLSDTEMPRMDGIDACRLVREWEAESGAPRTPLINMTGNSMLEDRTRAIEAGFDDFLSKPVARPKLEAVLAKLNRDPALANEVSLGESATHVTTTSSRRKKRREPARSASGHEVISPRKRGSRGSSTRVTRSPSGDHKLLGLRTTSTDGKKAGLRSRSGEGTGMVRRKLSADVLMVHSPGMGV